MSHVTTASPNHPSGHLEAYATPWWQRKCWMDSIKEWTSLPMPELLTTASCRKDWKRIWGKFPWWPDGPNWSVRNHCYVKVFTLLANQPNSLTLIITQTCILACKSKFNLQVLVTKSNAQIAANKKTVWPSSVNMCKVWHKTCSHWPRLKTACCWGTQGTPHPWPRYLWRWRWFHVHQRQLCGTGTWGHLAGWTHHKTCREQWLERLV